MAPTLIDVLPKRSTPLPTKPAPTPYAMTVLQAAAYIGLSDTSIRRAIYAGELPSRKTCDGGVHLIRTAELEAWYDRLPGYFDDTDD